MKKRHYVGLFIIVAAILALTACQSTTTPTSKPTGISPSASAYPAPVQNQIPTVSAYPGPGQVTPNSVSWSDVESALMAGKAVQAYVDQSGYVTLVLNDKSVIMALGPTPDAFSKLVTQCGAVCKDLKITKQ